MCQSQIPSPIFDLKTHRGLHLVNSGLLAYRGRPQVLPTQTES